MELYTFFNYEKNFEWEKLRRKSMKLLCEIVYCLLYLKIETESP